MQDVKSRRWTSLPEGGPRHLGNGTTEWREPHCPRKCSGQKDGVPKCQKGVCAHVRVDTLRQDTCEAASGAT